MYQWNEEYTEQELKDEIECANFLRVLDAMVYSWENDDPDIKTMADQLEAANAVIDGKLDYKQMIKKFDMKDILYS